VRVDWQVFVDFFRPYRDLKESHKKSTSNFEFEIFMALVLVTGGSGFLGSHCIIKLLEAGYSVRTSVRSPSRESEVRAMLSTGGITSFDKLSFAIADLTKDDGWAAAITGCEYVLHVASPMSGTSTRNEDDLIIPAREGTLRILRFARDLGVKRVVLTSSFGAVGYGPIPARPFTEDDWTDPNGPIEPYIKSKTLAEQAAWNFIKNEGGALQLVVLNPVGIFGPALAQDTSSSLGIIEALLNGSMPRCPNISFGLVDVRDVADIEVKALTNPEANGQRFILTAGKCMSLIEIGQVLRENLGERAARVPTKRFPNWAVKFLALFSCKLKAIRANLGIVRNASNAKALRTFEWSPTPVVTTIVDTAESLFRVGKVVL
jgi:dihydroflavonol-4-reductase